MSSYTEEEKNKIFDDIIKEIEEENMSLAKSVKGRIALNTFYRWCDDDKEKQKRYVRASEIRQELMFEQIIQIADESEDDTFVDANGNTRTNNDVPQRSRLRMDARKWALSKMNPKKYGDKIDHTTDGEKIEPTTIKWGGNDVNV